ncbi:hypothetical protein [Nostoc sp.]
MQPTISIPQHWGYPRFALEQRTQQGIILGFHYYPNGIAVAKAVRTVGGKRAFNSVLCDFIAVLSYLSVAIIGVA